MKKRIFKYPIRIEDIQSIKLPIGAEILCVQTQNNEPFIWALVDPSTDADMMSHTFELFGTGHEVTYDMGIESKYIGTFQLHGGDLIFHLFLCTGV